MKIDDIKPIMTFIDKTEKLLQDQGYTYNEAGMTYNSDISYGGIYGIDTKGPVMKISDYKP